MTLAEKILARASGLDRVSPDQIVVAQVDLAMSHENADLVRKSFLEIGMPKVWDPSKIVIIFDHRIPAESEKTATTHKAVREFAAAQGIDNFYDVGRGGICHQVLPGERPRAARHGAGGNRFAHHHARRVRRLRHRASAPPKWPACGPRARCGSRCPPRCASKWRASSGRGFPPRI